MKAILFALTLVLVGCSSSSSYIKKSKDYGYTDQVVDNQLRQASFVGNSKTTKDRAALFAKFRAIEVCHDLKNPLTHFLQIKDKTYSKEVSQAYTSYPSYYYGASPYYGSMGMGGYYGPASTTVSNETYTYPSFEVYFECTPTPMDARMAFKELSQSQVSQFLNDLKGAVQVDQILPDSPNKDTLKVADIIYQANGTRVATLLELFRASRQAGQKDFKVDIIREGSKKQVTVNFLDVKDKAMEAQHTIIKEACKISDLKDSNELCKK
jgi:hypothetical protein